MDLKEKIIGSVITMLSTKFNSTDLTFVQNVLAVCLHDYTVMQTKELPSNEVLNNDNIIRHYMATKKMEGLSIKTLKTYKHHIYKFFDFSHLFVQDVDTNSVRFYLASLETHASKSFTDDARRILNTFFSFCEDEGYITKNPVKKIKRIKQNKIMKAPYSDIEVEMIRDVCSTPREKALVSFLFSTGASSIIGRFSLGNSSPIASSIVTSSNSVFCSGLIDLTKSLAIFKPSLSLKPFSLLYTPPTF